MSTNSNSAASFSKEPFEKVRSLLERRKLFEALIQRNQEFVCKSQDEGELFTLRPLKIENEQTVACIFTDRTTPNNTLVNKDTEIIANFALEPDRYFMHAPMKIQNNRAMININSDIYKLQRRQSFRIAIPPSVPIYINIIELQGKKAFLDAKLADLSAGGARIWFPDQEVPIVSGMIMSGVLHPPSGKTIPFQAEVKHLLASVVNGEMKGQYGIEFKNVDPVFKNRMTSLTMDLQHKIIIGLA